MKGSIVIITWNQEALLQRCLSALFRQVDRSSVEVLVIDNGSKDGTVGMVRSMFPDVHLSLNSENLGVARARNQGISVSRGEYIVLLDDDTECNVNGKVKVYQLWENKSVPPRGKKLVPMRVELSYHHLPVDQNV